MRPNFTLHPYETPSAAIVRLYKHIRTIKPGHLPKSHYAKSVQSKKAVKPLLTLVKQKHDIS